MTKELEKLRSQIDIIDNQLLDLIAQRLDFAINIGEYKKKEQSKNKKGVVAYMKPERQAEVLRRVKDYAQKNKIQSEEQLLNIFCEIISLCLNAESLTKAVYLGPAGTYTQQAAIKYFGKTTALTPVHSIHEVFREVEANNSLYGVVPIENSTEGMVSNTMDVLVDSRLKIVGEIKMAIHHCLLGHPWTESLKDLSLIFSHQQSIAQCRLWLSEHLPDIEIRVENSNSRAAQQTMQTPNSAAIAGELNANLYGLKLIAKNIEDQPDNTTRFFILGDQETVASGNDKTSIVVGAKNQPGSLYKLLECFYKENVDLTLLESHPTRMGDWQYNFFIDCLGHLEDKPIKNTIEHLKLQSSFIKLLGSYPCSI